MEWISDPAIWTALLTLTALEIVLGIDNIIFISILTGKLPPEQQEKGRIIGLVAAMIMRIILLFFASWIVSLTEPLFDIFDKEFSGKGFDSPRRWFVPDRQGNHGVARQT